MCIRLISSFPCICQFDRHGPCLPAKGCGFPSNRKHVKLLWTPAFSSLISFNSALNAWKIGGRGFYFKGLLTEFGWNGFAEWPMLAVKAPIPSVCFFSMVVTNLTKHTKRTILCFVLSWFVQVTLPRMNAMQQSKMAGGTPHPPAFPPLLEGEASRKRGGFLP